MGILPSLTLIEAQVARTTLAVHVDFSNVEDMPWFAESVIEAANEFMPGHDAQEIVEIAKQTAKFIKPEGPFEFPEGVDDIAASYHGPGGDDVPPQKRDTRVTDATPAFVHYFEKNNKVRIFNHQSQSNRYISLKITNHL